MKNWMKGIAAVAAVVFVSMTVTACNTVEGVGKDTQNAGKSIEKAADKNK